MNMVLTRSEQTKAFAKEGEEMGLKKETIAKLVAEDIDTCAILCLCSSVDIDELQLSRGQTLVLKQWLSHLTLEEEVPAAPPSVTDQPTETLDLLLGQMETVPAIPGNAVSSPLGKPLLIVDHVNCVVGGVSDAAEHQVYSHGDTQLFFRSARPKPSPDRVTLAQWVGANARILQELIRKGNIQSLEDVDAYLQYNVIFSDYAQVNELSSALVYDHEFRRKQHAQSKPWDQDDFHLANFHLRKRDPAQRNQMSQRRPRSTSDPRDSSGVEICRNYNASGCDRPVCRYSHSCAVCRVKGHPSAAHGNNQTFRPQAPPFASRPV